MWIHIFNYLGIILIRIGQRMTAESVRSIRQSIWKIIPMGIFSSEFSTGKLSASRYLDLNSALECTAVNQRPVQTKEWAV